MPIQIISGTLGQGMSFSADFLSRLRDRQSSVSDFGVDRNFLPFFSVKTFSRTWPQVINTPYSFDLTLHPFSNFSSRSLPSSNLLHSFASSKPLFPRWLFSAVRSPDGALIVSNFQEVF